MNKLLLIAIVLLAAGCKEKFISPVPPVATGYLVLEGVVSNEGSSDIRLSRTTNLNDNNIVPELGAQVTITDSSNNSLSLLETSAGTYSIDNLHLDTSRRYRLSVKTTNNEEYLSDFVPVKNNPPIDSINWVRDNKGVQLYIDTHDPQNNTRYYQWEYVETWEFHSTFAASLKYIQSNSANIGVTPRGAGDPLIYACWQTDSSNTILLGSSLKLSQDIIHLPLTSIPGSDWKISVLYSILVKQYTWTKEGYDFLERMKKNTESVGSVFDAQPSELNSNIRCTSNPKLPAIGFFNICPAREKRIFINNSEVPGWGYRTNCSENIVENNPDSIQAKAVGELPTTTSKTGAFGVIVLFAAAPSECVDCTLRGTNVKPTYWP